MTRQSLEMIELRIKRLIELRDAIAAEIGNPKSASTAATLRFVERQLNAAEGAVDNCYDCVEKCLNRAYNRTGN